MATIINEIIPMQGFEFVALQIQTILNDELLNQKILQDFDSNFEVFLERQEAYDNSEDVMINVSLNGINYSETTQKDSQGSTSYFIDVYTPGVESDSQTGNEDSRKKMHLFIGMIRYILSSTKYQSLGFPIGLIGGKYVENIQFLDNYGNQDASFIRFGRITFSVRIQENQESWTGITITGNDTTIKLDTTDEGFKLTKNN